MMRNAHLYDKKEQFLRVIQDCHLHLWIEASENSETTIVRFPIYLYVYYLGKDL